MQTQPAVITSRKDWIKVAGAFTNESMAKVYDAHL